MSWTRTLLLGAATALLPTTVAAAPLVGVEVTIPLTVTTPAGEQTYRMAAVEYRPSGGGPFPPSC